MSSVYALVVGIDAYRATRPLRGCRNDATAAVAYLRSRFDGERLHILDLYDEQATRQAIVAALRDHLGQARTGDTALFWFAGHGSLAPVPRALWHLEPSGWMQSLVCVDSRDGDVPDLYDKELSVLLDRVAVRGCHVAVVLDSCYSAGGAREVPEPGARARLIPPAARLPAATALIPELGAGWTGLPDRSRHVLLAACRSDQLAQELPIDAGEPRGIFSWALLRALAQFGPHATYRELLAAARCAVEDKVSFQAPQLVGDEPADQPFLGGAVRRPASGITMRHVAGHWEIDAGTCHGMPAPSAGPFRVAVADDPPRAARVTAVLVDRAIVEPDGWTPDPERQYQVVVTQLPQAALTVAVDGPPELAELVATSPFLRLPAPDEPLVPDLRFRSAAPGRAEILGTDGLALVPPIVAENAEQCAWRTVRAGEHIARWRQVHSLTNPGSRLAGGVRLEVVEARAGERTVPLERPAIAPGDDGLIRLEYRRRHGAWVAPTVFLRLHNTTGKPLYCVLLDMTGRYRIHGGLFPGAFVGANRRGAALAGRPVQFRLPSGVPPLPGTTIRDWLKLVVAEEEFSGRPFEQGPLDEATGRGALSRVSMTRDAGAADLDDAYDWSASTVGVVTVVPG